MKRVFILGLSASLLVGGISSCRKTSKGKMANEWTVSAYNSEYKSTDGNGDVYNSTEVLNGSVLNRTSTYSPNGGVSSTMQSSTTVSAWTYTLAKDGTWSMLSNTTFTGLDSTFNDLTWEFDTFTLVETNIEEMSGVWNFIDNAGSEDFSKNERFMLSFLKGDFVNTRKEGNSAPVTTTNSAVLDGTSETMVYTVVESSKKELMLKAESTESFVSTSGTDVTKVLETMTFTQK